MPVSIFSQRLASFAATEDGRHWVFVPYDQLTDAIGPLATRPPNELGIVMVESRWKARQRPYAKQKLAFILTNMRHFALEQAQRGVAVRYVTTDAPYAEALRPHCEELGPLTVMRPAERELRHDLASLEADDLLTVVSHEGWLTTTNQFESLGEAPWQMGTFYRTVRRDTGILMNADGKPEGGKFNFDAENRKPWRGTPPAPTPLAFDVDEIGAEVGTLIEQEFAEHPGRLDLSMLPATAEDARAVWTWALASCLPHFGPFEDAMSTANPNLFHTRVSALLHLHRLLPSTVVSDVADSDLPIASREGFVRQVLGWREFVRHVHEATDGFRSMPGVRRADADPAQPSRLHARASLPAAYWGTASGLNCLDTVVRDVWNEGSSHHITRLMVLSNIATLLSVSPRELTDWFWVAYIDAFDWVVEPNVLAMGSFGTGPLMTTKPYVSGAAYINRMSDYCTACVFNPRTDCPITRMYWQFLARNESRLAGNHRMSMPLRSLSKRSAEDRAEDRRTLHRVRKHLRAGKPLAPRSQSP